MRSIAVVTGTRADYGIYLPVLRAIQADPPLEARLMVCGAHLSKDFGQTVDAIEADGFAIEARIDTLVEDDTPDAVARSMGLGLAGFGEAFARFRPDVLLVLGDRYEMFTAVAAAMPFAIPTAHIHGGESTEGLIDEAIRHSITKMSHLHFASTESYARRIVQMGERPGRVFVSGAPSLDNLKGLTLLSRGELEARLGLTLDRAPLLVTFHPVTLEYEETDAHISDLLGALAAVDDPIVITYPNADTRGRAVIRAIESFASGRTNARAIKSLGTQAYFSLMNIAAAMVGNSSSGIIEAASFALPVVNVGNRQRGRVHGANVIDCSHDRASITAALNHALERTFRESIAGMANPYGNGTAADRIVSVLREATLDRDLIEKRFYDLAAQ